MCQKYRGHKNQRMDQKMTHYNTTNKHYTNKKYLTTTIKQATNCKQICTNHLLLLANEAHLQYRMILCTHPIGN